MGLCSVALSCVEADRRASFVGDYSLRWKCGARADCRHDQPAGGGTLLALLALDASAESIKA